MVSGELHDCSIAYVSIAVSFNSLKIFFSKVQYFLLKLQYCSILYFYIIPDLKKITALFFLALVFIQPVWIQVGS